MYKDIITYQLAEQVTKEQMITAAQRVANEWMKHQAGFVKWEIHTTSDGNYTDIVYWQSREAAVAAEKAMVNIPNAAEWFGCYKEGSISSKNLTKVAEL